MQVPALFSVYDDSLHAVDGWFTSSSARYGDRRQDFAKAVSEAVGRDGGPYLVVDCNSFEERRFSEKVMKHMSIKGSEQWLMTCINTVEDVFDAFNKDAEYVFGPYHMILDDYELKDICDVSDSFIPTVFVHNGKAVLPGGKLGDVIKTLEKLVSVGYYKNCVLDTEVSLDGYSWSVISEDYPSTIPFIDRPSDDKGFEDVITPYLM